MIRTSGLALFTTSLTREVATIDARVELVVRKTVIDGAKYAALYSRKDTHATEASILSSPEVKRHKEGVIGEWGSTTHYDPYQEYGTSHGISPNWHHRRAFERVRDPFIRALEEVSRL